MGNKMDPLGDRMKENYENRSKTYLVRRMPVIIRLDGRSWHTFTKGFKRPYDEILHNAMNATMKYLCENIQGCKLGYTQSDEITLLLTDYDTLTTDAWFGNSVQKLCSVSASMATMAFNKFFEKNYFEWKDKTFPIDYLGYNTGMISMSDIELMEKYIAAINKGAMFDSRCFNIPEDEVTNCFVWRQQDATRNAIQMLGQCYFSHKELNKKSQNDIQDMLMTQKSINFNDMPIEFKRGVCCVKNRHICEPYGNRMLVSGAKEGEWVIDKNIPIFTQDRDYIEDVFRVR